MIFFEQENMDRFEKQGRQYYQGNDAPAPGIVFQWLKAFSDGSTQQVINAIYIYVTVLDVVRHLCRLELVLFMSWKMCV